MYQIYHHDAKSNRHHKVAELNAVDARAAALLVQDWSGGRWQDDPAIKAAPGEHRSTRPGDIVIDEGGVELRIDAIAGARVQFTEVTAILDQREIDHLAAIDDALTRGFDLTGVNGRLETERVPQGWESAEGGVKLFEEWHADYEAAKQRDSPDLIDYERSLRQPSSKGKDKEHER